MDGVFGTEAFEALGPQLATLGLAALLAGGIGLERELQGKPAGLRTHILVGLSSALLVLLGDVYVARFHSEFGGGLVQADPIRLIQAVVVGISFLGAGTILHEGGSRVEGLTTAASILLTAGIGIAVALGAGALAACVTVAVVALLVVLRRLERWLGSKAAHTGAESVREERVGDRTGGAPPGAAS